MKLIFLGTGTSHGVPSLDCMINDHKSCRKDVCRRSLYDKKHSRTRSSLFIEHEKGNILIDVSSDFREQALRERIKSIHSVLLTHAHADHISGIPDIRSYTRSAPLNMYGSAETLQSVRQTFSYAFSDISYPGGGVPELNTIEIKSPIKIHELDITPVPVTHGLLSGCLGYRVANVGYVPDIKAITPKAMELLSGLDILILDCLHDGKEHSTHLTLGESVALARDLSPEKCYFIHMSHLIDYEADSASLDPWMEFACDGLSVEV
ncbi:putative hydrolase [Chitinispirillum alkaliphilum]|nr:putative hydrolase [Chitinispirillum alkaliphilum]